MLQVLLFSLVTTSSAFTTHRYDTYDSFGNYRPSASFLDNIFGYENNNGRRPVEMHENSKQYDGVVISNANRGPVVKSDGENRRSDIPYQSQSPHQWNNRQVPRNKDAVTEPTKFFNRFENSDQYRNYVYIPNNNNRSLIVQQDKEEVTNQMSRKINETQGNVSEPQISTQLDDVNRTLVIHEQQITWNNDHQGSGEVNANIATRSINSGNNTNDVNVSNKQNADTINRPTKTDGKTANNRNRPNSTASGDKYNTKTTQDNEVTPNPHEQRKKANDDDRWVWGNAPDQVVQTTTPGGVGDRAAFSGDGCPDGKVKVGNTCVVKD